MCDKSDKLVRELTVIRDRIDRLLDEITLEPKEYVDEHTNLEKKPINNSPLLDADTFIKSIGGSYCQDMSLEIWA